MSDSLSCGRSITLFDLEVEYQFWQACDLSVTCWRDVVSELPIQSSSFPPGSSNILMNIHVMTVVIVCLLGLLPLIQVSFIDCIIYSYFLALDTRTLAQFLQYYIRGSHNLDHFIWKEFIESKYCFWTCIVSNDSSDF